MNIVPGGGGSATATPINAIYLRGEKGVRPTAPDPNATKLGDVCGIEIDCDRLKKRRIPRGCICRARRTIQGQHQGAYGHHTILVPSTVTLSSVLPVKPIELNVPSVVAACAAGASAKTNPATAISVIIVFIVFSMYFRPFRGIRSVSLPDVAPGPQSGSL